MAVVPNIVDRGAAGDLFYRVVDLTLDNTYAAGGFPLSAQQLGFGLNGVIYAASGLSARGGFLYEWDHVNKKLIVRDASGGAGVATPEVANALAALNGIVVRLIFWGKGQG